MSSSRFPELKKAGKLKAAPVSVIAWYNRFFKSRAAKNHPREAANTKVDLKS